MQPLPTGITWFIAEHIIEISGASRELIEAIAGVSAVGVLFWVSFWVLNRIETKKWIEFVKAKIWKATTTGGVTVFIMLSFFTVYREGFETVLFYQAMLSFAKYMEWYVIAGLTLGLIVIVGIAFIVRKLGKKLPLRVLFGLTMAIGAYMSITFIGNAVRSFQEAGYISATHMIGIIPRLDINLGSNDWNSSNARDSRSSAHSIICIHCWIVICINNSTKKKEEGRKIKKVHGRCGKKEKYLI